MIGRHITTILSALCLLGLSARGDGGVIRSRETQGPFVVTIFTPANPARNVPLDVSVLAQERDTGEPILDATVDLVFTAPAAQPLDDTCGPSKAASPSMPATRRQASNKLLYAAQVKFNADGPWRLQARIRRGGDEATFACAIPVGPPPRGVMALFPYLLFPPVMIGLFALNHRLRH